MDRSQRGVHHERLKIGSSRAANVLFVTSFCESWIFSVSCDTGTSEVQPLLDLPHTAHCRFQCSRFLMNTNTSLRADPDVSARQAPLFSILTYRVCHAKHPLWNCCGVQWVFRFCRA
jgi:hypothetical protein